MGACLWAADRGQGSWASLGGAGSQAFGCTCRVERPPGGTGPSDKGQGCFVERGGGAEERPGLVCEAQGCRGGAGHVAGRPHGGDLGA